MICPRCTHKFLVLTDVRCTGVKVARSSRTTGDHFSFEGIGETVWRTKWRSRVTVRFANPDPTGSPERLFEFDVRGRAGDLHLRSGDRFSVVEGRDFLGRPKPRILVNHTVGRAWRL